MPRLIDVRLTAIGARSAVNEFEQWRWPGALRAQHVELLEHSRRRRVWLYQTIAPTPFKKLHCDSAKWPHLDFFIEYDGCSAHIKGLSKAVAGKIDRCELAY